MTDNGDAGDGGRAHKARDAASERVLPRRSRHARNRLVMVFNLLLSLAVFAMIGGAALLYWGRGEFDGPGPLTAEATFLIPRNTGLESIAGGLERKGIISSARVFEYGVRAAGVAGELKAGEYGFAPGVSMREVVEKLRKGDSILRSVTIPEGWTVKQVFDRVAGDEALTGDLPPMPAEGTLRPDTYKFTRGMKRGDLVAQMSDAQSKLVAELWKERDSDLPITDVGQFVTLASIVEKETGIPAERPHVASVFINRLREGMRLQSDPTFLYGVYGGSGKPSDAPITAADRTSDTPYNTYVIRGLPPGPIANPGRAALEAVAKPMQSKDLYFVADGTGGHAFARTNDEHNVNVRRYRALAQRTGETSSDAADVE